MYADNETLVCKHEQRNNMKKDLFIGVPLTLLLFKNTSYCNKKYFVFILFLIALRSPPFSFFSDYCAKTRALEMRT